MPDLSQKASLEYWNEYPDPMIFRVIALMESMENWTYDGNPELEKAFVALGNSLEGATNFELKKQDEYLNFGNHIHVGRILRIMQAIDTTHPGSASRLLMHAEETTKNDEDPAGLFLRRNIVFERLRLLGRVFSTERLTTVQKALERDDEDE
jgi:intracellular multiplication protein IcmW